MQSITHSPDLLVNTCTFLHYTSLLSVERVCKLFQQVSNHNYIWVQLCRVHNLQCSAASHPRQIFLQEMKKLTLIQRKQEYYVKLWRQSCDFSSKTWDILKIISIPVLTISMLLFLLSPGISFMLLSIFFLVQSISSWSFSLTSIFHGLSHSQNICLVDFHLVAALVNTGLFISNIVAILFIFNIVSICQTGFLLIIINCTMVSLCISMEVTQFVSHLAGDIEQLVQEISILMVIGGPIITFWVILGFTLIGYIQSSYIFYLYSSSLTLAVLFLFGMISTGSNGKLIQCALFLTLVAQMPPLFSYYLFSSLLVLIPVPAILFVALHSVQ